jgi:hypothetical protein
MTKIFKRLTTEPAPAEDSFPTSPGTPTYFLVETE